MEEKIKIALRKMKELADRANRSARNNVNNSVMFTASNNLAQTYLHCICIVEAETGVSLNDDKTEGVSND